MGKGTFGYQRPVFQGFDDTYANILAVDVDNDGNLKSLPQQMMKLFALTIQMHKEIFLLQTQSLKMLTM